jgi:N-methylhydantoinase B
MAGTCGLVALVFGGHDPRPGIDDEFVAYLWFEGGWGARPGKKDNHTAMTLSATSSTNQPIELHERLLPIMYDAYGYETDSAGAGFHRGGCGVTKSWHLTHGGALLSVIGDREKGGPWGYAGGLPGRPHTVIYAPRTAEEETLGMFRSGMPIDKDREVVVHMAGGGGYGQPFERPEHWVLEDVIDGLVSVGAARDLYGVVINEIDTDLRTYVIDRGRTDAIRAAASIPP